MSRIAKWSLTLVWLGGLVLAFAAPAQAGLIPAAVTVAPDSGNYRFTYSVVLPSNYSLHAGDYFTIYDFHGLMGGNQQPAGWTYSTSNVGQTPPGILPVDDPKVPNLTWTYSGATISGSSGGVGLGDFSVLSGTNGMINSDFASTDHMMDNGRGVSNLTSTSTPDPNSVPPRTPEPASFVLLGLSVPVLGAWRWLKRRAAR
ncbi:MAG TPA: hypothetical protein VKS79_13795 [Gemmataceae bacterium]|nr:hypothetical protein [Gemmataceae bacterium]